MRSLFPVRSTLNRWPVSAIRLVSLICIVFPLHHLRADPPKLIVAIVVDQMRYDYLERFEDQFVRDGFRLLMDRGAYMTSAHYNYYPTVTAPGHASYLSGTTPAMHGIVGNDWFDRRQKKIISSVDDPAFEGVGTVSTNVHISPRNFHGDNFADQLRLRYRSKVVGISLKARAAVLPAGKKPNGAYWFEPQSGNFITSSYYRPELPEWVRMFNERKLVEQYRDRIWSRLLPAAHYPYPDDQEGEGRLAGETNRVFPHQIHYLPNKGYEALLPTPYGNDLLAQLARAAIEGESLGKGLGPDLLCVSFSSLDACGHVFGPYSQEAEDVTVRLDRTLAEFFHYLDHRIGLKHVAIVLTADHGGAPLAEFAREQGLDAGRINETKLFSSLTNHLAGRFGPEPLFLLSRFHYGSLFYDYDVLKNKGISQAELSDAISEWAQESGKYQAVFTRQQILTGGFRDEIGQMVARGYDQERSGDIVLILKPYLIPSSGRTGTTHGSPYSYDAHIPVLFYGQSFRPGHYAGDFRITDIVPTLCATLDMDEPAGNIGRAFLPAISKQ